MLICYPFSGWAEQYCVKATGLAEKAGSVVFSANECTNAANNSAMSMSNFNGVTFSAGDTVYFSASAGDYSIQMTIPSGGNSDADVAYEGLADGAADAYPLIDVSGNIFNAAGVSIVNKSYITLKNFRVKGSGGNGAFRVYGNSGHEGYTVNVYNVSVLSNYGASDATNSHDCFSAGGTAQAQFQDCSADKCRPETDPFVGSHQALTTHESSMVKWYRGSMSDSNYFAVAVTGSRIDIYNANCNDAKIVGFDSPKSWCNVYDSTIVSNTGKVAQSGSEGTVRIESSDITINSGTLTLISGVLELIDNRLVLYAPDFRWAALNADGIIIADGNDIKIADCSTHLFSGPNGYQGAYKLYRNLVTATSTDGFVVISDTSADSSILYNIFNKCLSSDVISVHAGIENDHMVANNLFYRANPGGVGIEIDGPAAEGAVGVHNNIFYNISNSIQGGEHATSISHNDYYNSSYEGGIGSIDSDPRFLSVGNDFRLQTDSPCIMQGAEAGVLGLTGEQTDFFDNTLDFDFSDLMNIGPDQKSLTNSSNDDPITEQRNLSKNTSSSGGCFIATAAYGSSMVKEIQNVPKNSVAYFSVFLSD